MVLVVGAMILLAVVQSIGGVLTFVGDALVIALYLFLVAMSWMLGYVPSSKAEWGEASELLEHLARLLLSVALVSAILAFVQVLDVWAGVGWVSRMPQLRRPGANLGQPNHLATLLIMGFASLLYLYESRRLTAWTATLLFTVVALALAATESRTGLLNLVLLGLWWAVGRRRVGFRVHATALMVAGLAALGMFWAWPQLMSTSGQYAPGAEFNTSAGLRLVVWPQLIEAVLQHPWLGWGLREVSKAHNAVAHAYAVSEPFTYAHNIVLDLAVGVGLPLTALLVAMSSVWLWRRLRAVRNIHTWYCVAAVLPVAVHSMLEFPFAYAYFLAPAMFLLGVLDGATGGKAVGRIGVKPAAVVLLMVSLVGAWTVVEYFKVEEDFRIVRFESLRLGKTPQDYERPHIYLLTQLDALLKGGRIVPAPGMSSEQQELARKVAMRYPWPATQSRYALSLALNGQAAEALRQLQVIRALHGKQIYTEIKSNWVELSRNKYPQLRDVIPP